MSSERYRVVRQLECDTYYVGSPVQIEKGNILLDSQTSNLILQLKLCNVSDKTVSAVYLSADYYDNTNHLLHSGVELNYLGLNCAPKQACGSDTPMKLTDNNIYNVKFHIAKVMFIDGSMIDVAPQTIQIPKQQQIAEVFGDEAAGAAKWVLNNSVCYIPQELDSGVWLCGCGQANEKEDCISCGITKNKVFEAVNGEYLHNAVLEYNEVLEKKAKRKKTKKISIIILILAVIISGIISCYMFFNPNADSIYDKLHGTWMSYDNKGYKIYFSYETDNKEKYQTLDGERYYLSDIKRNGIKDFQGYINFNSHKVEFELNGYELIVNDILFIPYGNAIKLEDYEGNVILETSEIKNAKVKKNKSDNKIADIQLTLTEEGKRIFQKAIEEISQYDDTKNYISIYWNDEIIAAPQITEETSSNEIIFSGISYDGAIKLIEEINKWK